MRVVKTTTSAVTVKNDLAMEQIMFDGLGALVQGRFRISAEINGARFSDFPTQRRKNFKWLQWRHQSYNLTFRPLPPTHPSSLVESALLRGRKQTELTKCPSLTTRPRSCNSSTCNTKKFGGKLANVLSNFVYQPRR
ncbi:hypothetical protein ISN44_As01g003560 [Arabidopsis suecica]|uniref:Uncharacterized protein n=1 Tax=Arabidopsis suecica TaxID=45249 RepID=A0A8T2H015_ARASU|nr:hypothetical protein ISN44_As01g003560 [Arabidopsis suecica]